MLVFQFWELHWDMQWEVLKAERLHQIPKKIKFKLNYYCIN